MADHQNRDGHAHPHGEHDHPHPHAHPHPHDAPDQGQGDHPHPHAHPHPPGEHDHPHGDHEHAHGAHDHSQGDHDHAHGEHDHVHEQPKNVVEWIMAIFHLGKFGHSHGEMSGNILLTSSRGMWALKWSFAGLMVTAVMQVVIVYFSGSVGLLADTIHNFGDAVTAIPLWIAFSLARRPATRRYTYGYGRAEDLAGVLVVVLILFSAVVAAWEAVNRIFNPQEITYLEWVAAAGIIGFIGNEAVALFRIRVGREIGSAALIADGQHARIDGLTSLAVLGGAIGVWLGFPLADPIVGLLISVAIVRIAWNATKQMWYRMMDAAEPAVVDKVEQTARGVPGVRGVHCVRARWVGHRLFAEVHIEVDQSLSVVEAHSINEEVQHALFHALPRLSEAAVHVDLACDDQAQFHQPTLHHRDEGALVAAEAGGGNGQRR